MVSYDDEYNIHPEIRFKRYIDQMSHWCDSWIDTSKRDRVVHQVNAWLNTIDSTTAPDTELCKSSYGHLE
eukprot:11505357-Karenia_brevis.AAC.1